MEVELEKTPAAVTGAVGDGVLCSLFTSPCGSGDGSLWELSSGATVTMMKKCYGQVIVPSFFHDCIISYY